MPPGSRNRRTHEPSVSEPTEAPETNPVGSPTVHEVPETLNRQDSETATNHIEVKGKFRIGMKTLTIASLGSLAILVAGLFHSYLTS